MKKPKCNILKEFKAFITRGNVIDLAVGMIIGAAFTAIVTALVNGIFKPLIDAIPVKDDLSGLITMLVPAFDETGAVDLTKSVYINWGDFIMAIVNFFLTAVILFAIVKVINTVRGGMSELAGENIALSKEEKKELRAKGMNRKQMKEYAEKKAADEAAAKAAKEAEALANAPESSEKILADIRALLQSLQAAQTTDTADNK